MGEFLPGDEETIREYLLGRVSAEATLERLEEFLFTDDEFCSAVALAEDDIINDYVFGRLNNADAESFRATLNGNHDRRFKFELTEALKQRALVRDAEEADAKPSLFASLAAFFRQPKYVGAFALLLIAVIVAAVYLSRRPGPDDLAELRSIYRQARPTETRISEFGYAPMSQLRGEPVPAEKNRLRRIENNLIEATEKSPNSESYHSLGVFHLTQQKYPDAIKEFENALKFEENNAKIHNDLGAAHFELAKTEAKEKRLEELEQALEEFTKATKLDANFLEALFNRSLALQELAPRQAKDSWTLYLQKDPSSPWADEARKNLARIESEQSLFKTDEEVLSDFLAAHRDHDYERAQKIHNETKGLLKGVTVPLQVSRRYLLAKQRGNEPDARESLKALAFIGDFEQAQNGDSFFFELANFYASAGADKIEQLIQAKDTFTAAEKSSSYATRIAEFEKSRDLFERLGNDCEAAIAEIWAVQYLPDVARVAESRQRLEAIIATAEDKKFKVLGPAAYYWLGVSDYRQKRLSESSQNLRTALRLAQADNNTFEIQHAEDALAANYSEIGELEPALFYASNRLSDRAHYYQNQNQSVRNYGTLATLALKLNFLSTSLSLSQESLSIVQQFWPNTSRVNDSLNYVVNAASASGDLDAALNYARDSLQIARNGKESAENTKTTADSYRLFADVKRRMKNCSEALPDYDKALELYSRLPEITDSLYQIHKGRLFCLQQLDRRDDFSDELRKVLELSEEYRNTIREDSSRQAFFATEQDVFDAATTDAIKQHDNRQAFEFVETSKARSLLDFVQSKQSIAEVEKNFAAVARPLSLPAIQTRLPEQVQLIQYAVLPDRLAIWVISRTRFDFVEKEISAAELEKKINAYQVLIVGKGPPSQLGSRARELYDLLIPFDLAADKQLCFVPDKSLHQLPFATLVSQNGKYLLQDHALFYAPSASVLVLATENARRKENRNESILSVGDPDFNREENPNLPGLEDAQIEAKTIAADYPKSQELLGDQATKEKFLHSFVNAEVVHFAGHFFANQQSPGNSKLLFAGGDLRAFELSAYKLPRAKLVVLSACETGFERYNQSEGAIGIARTLLALGVPIVVASGWKVDSEPTKDLMIAFHRNRKEKRMTSAESLRQAQLEVLNQDKTSAPFYWAAFSLFGGYANY